MAIETTGVRLEVSDANSEQVIREATELFKGFNTAIEKVTNTIVRFNSAGTLVGASISGLGANGERIAATLKKGAEGYFLQAKAAEDSATRQINAQKKLADQLFNIKNQSLKQIDAIEQRSLEADEAARSRQVLKAQQLQLRNLTNQKNLADQLFALKSRTQQQNDKIEEQTRRAEEKAASRANLLTQRGQAAVAVKEGITPSNIGTLAAQSQAAIQKQTESVARLVANGKLSVQQVEQISSQVAAGVSKTYIGAANTAQTAFQKIQTLTAQPPGISNLSKALIDLGGIGTAAFKQIESAFTRFLSVAPLAVAVGGIFRLVQGLQDGVAAALQLQVRISEIRTISLRNQISFDQATESVRKLSDQLGQPISDVAEGAYQAISNQVVKSTESFNFLQTALRLSKTTVSTTAQAVGTLSTVINAFGKNASDAEDISAVLFKTVELGRVRLDQLDGVLGVSSTFAGDLGLSFEELAASIAVLTRQGVPAETAGVLINNVLSALLKPTPEMAKAFKTLGVNSGFAALQTQQFGGVLANLDQGLRDGNLELGKLIPNLRGTRGAVSLTGKGLEDFQNTLQEIKINSLGDQLQANSIIVESSGAKILLELNKIKNFFTVDFGFAVVESLQRVTSNFGGLANTVISVTKSIPEIAGSLITVIAGLRGASIAAAALSGEVTVLGVALTGLGATVALIFGAATFGASIGIGLALLNKQLDEAIKKSLDFNAQFRAANDAAIEAGKAKFTEAIKSQENIIKKIVEDRFRFEFIKIAELKTKYTEFIEQQRTIQNQAATELKVSFEGYKIALSDGLRILQESESKAKRSVESARKGIEDIRRLSATNQFQNQFNDLLQTRSSSFFGNSFQEVTGLFNKQRAKLRSLVEIAAQAGDVDEVKRIFTELQKLAEQYGSLRVEREKAFGAGPQRIREQERQTAKDIVNLQNEEIRNLSIIAQQKNAEAEAARAAIDAEKERIKAIEETFKAVVTFSGKEKGGKKFKSADEASQEFDRLQKAFESAVGDDASFFGQKLQFFTQFEAQKTSIIKAFEAERKDESLTQTQRELQDRAKLFKEQIATELSARSNLNNKIIDEARGINQAVDQAISQISVRLAQTEDIRGRLGKFAKTGFLVSSPDEIIDGKRVKEQLAIIGAEFAKLAKSSGDDITEEQIATLKERLKTLRQAQETTAQLQKLPADEIKAQLANFDILVGSVVRGAISDLEQTKNKVGEASENIEKLKKSLAADLNKLSTADQFTNSIKTLSTEELPILKAASADAFGALSTSASGSKITIDELTASIRIAQEALKNLQIQQNPQVAPLPARSMGGMTYFNAGGFLARGNDRRPAMLADHEFVVNANSSRKFFAQVSALNHGTPMRYYGQGGSVNNFGGITVNVNGQQSQGAIGREIGYELKREIRRGSFSFGR